MKSQRRFIKSIVATAQSTDVQMPWERGARRASFIAKRRETAKPQPVLRRA